MAKSSPSAYLVELLDTDTGELIHADITRHLANAFETVYAHLMDYHEMSIIVDVEHEESGGLAGVGFFNEEGEGLAFVSAYYLEREKETDEHPDLVALAHGDSYAMGSKLQKYFSF